MDRMIDRYLEPGRPIRVLDVGSYDVNGSYRPLFAREGWVYEGADMQPGPNVDHVLADPDQFPLADESYDVIVSGQAFEHIRFFWRTWREMVRVLRPGGFIFLIAPSRGVEHRHPVDCWRFYRDGFRALAELGGLEVLEADTRWDNPWGDTVGAFRKVSPPRGSDGSSEKEPLERRSTAVRDPAYARSYAMTLAEWMIRHQEEVVFDQVNWMGVKILKNPLDCWIYQEILWEVKPERIVEIGSLAGGSTLFFCHMLDILGRGLVVSVERDRSHFGVRHRRLKQVTGDCAEPAVRRRVEKLCRSRRTLVIHDADHTREAVLRDLRAYADLVTPGSYFIVEDGVVDVFDPRATTRLGWERPGPLAATREFVREDGRFVVDAARERYLITYNPAGFLKRVR